MQFKTCLVVLAVLACSTWAEPRARIGGNYHKMPSKMPSWWSNGARACDSGADCLDNECCARNMFAPRSFCSPMRARKETCDATPYLLDSAREVHYNKCPCKTHLTCASLDGASICMDYVSLEMAMRPSDDELPMGFYLNFLQNNWLEKNKNSLDSKTPNQ